MPWIRQLRITDWLVNVQVKKVQAIRDDLSPETKLDLDELGVILPNDNSPSAPMFPLIYWNAAGAMYAYLFGKLSVLGEKKKRLFLLKQLEVSEKWRSL